MRSSSVGGTGHLYIDGLPVAREAGRCGPLERGFLLHGPGGGTARGKRIPIGDPRGSGPLVDKGLPQRMPPYGTPAFRDLKLTMYLRKSFLVQSDYDEAAVAIAHELRARRSDVGSCLSPDGASDISGIEIPQRSSLLPFMRLLCGYATATSNHYGTFRRVI
jgi:hypothetical protein